MIGCVTDFISDTIDHFWNITLGALVVWFLIIATEVIKDQRSDNQLDDVQEEWQIIRHYAKRHIKLLTAKLGPIISKWR